jgi:hypothetical protein
LWTCAKLSWLMGQSLSTGVSIDIPWFIGGVGSRYSQYWLAILCSWMSVVMCLLEWDRVTVAHLSHFNQGDILSTKITIRISLQQSCLRFSWNSKSRGWSCLTAKWILCSCPVE